ncbi:DUF7118 family protein [Halomarina litorea]|uniref:DUF7118 family protein n=1 Tax=Halomarina litorea TaxID=2961595 RepID=UPI0020C571DF|nr:hypothetical protein [Halomarina sp. BCD28]
MSDSAVADLTDAADTLHDARERVAEVGSDRLERVADGHAAFVRTLDRHEDEATGYGEFEKYVGFQEAVADRLSDLPDDLPARGAFDAADEALQQQTLSTTDFDRAREALAPAAEYAALYEEWTAARERYREARSAVHGRRRALEERIDDLDRLVRLGGADLDAPTHRLRDPVAAYESAVREAFGSFRREASARDLLAFVETTEQYPLVPYDRPPERLREFVAGGAGTEPIPRLLEYADYSRSKLDHYVESPRELKAAVGTNQTYLDGLTADPLVVSWPPPPGERLRYRCEELLACVSRFADDDVAARLRAVRALPRETDYATLRESAVARADLTPEERERLASGSVESDLAAAREELERIEAALADHPPLSDLADV